MKTRRMLDRFRTCHNEDSSNTSSLADRRSCAFHPPSLCTLSSQKVSYSFLLFLQCTDFHSQFLKFKGNVAINVKCTAWADNFKESTNLRLFIEDIEDLKRD